MCKHEGCDIEPIGKRKQCQNCSTLRHKYGITTPERDAILESQDGKCKICHTEISFCGDSGIQRHVANVDHKHGTKQVRGVLCGMCNAGLGVFYDNTDTLLGAINYLKEAEDA